MEDVPDIQLVAVDVDGTLLRAKRKMSFKVINAIITASQRGVKVVLASARPPRTMREIYDHLKLDTPMINYNGALIHDPVQRRHIHHRPMDGSLVKRMIRQARKLDPKVIVSLEILDKWYTDDVDDSLPTETSRDFDPDFIGPLESFLHVPVTKLMLLAPPDRIGAIREVIERKYQCSVAIMVSDEHVLQIVHPDVDKGRALAMIAEGYGIGAEQAMAIGDAPNDLGMFEWARLGVAVENAWPAVREAADVVVAAAQEDGVAEALNRFVLT